jgi:hypothetical protein
MSRYRAHSGSCDRILLSVWKLLSCLCRALSVTRGRVCHSVSPKPMFALSTYLHLGLLVVSFPMAFPRWPIRVYFLPKWLPSRPPCLDHYNYIWQRILIMKRLVI